MVEAEQSSPSNAYRRGAAEAAAALGHERARKQPVGLEFTLKELARDLWPELSPVEQRQAGVKFRAMLADESAGPLDEWKTSDNEWHYRRQ